MLVLYGAVCGWGWGMKGGEGVGVKALVVSGAFCSGLRRLLLDPAGGRFVFGWRCRYRACFKDRGGFLKL